MRKNSLTPNKGLSLSQAQSISNLCNQSVIEIDSKLTSINNYSKTVQYGDKDLQLVVGNPMPANLLDLIERKAKLSACQAFLMENIKAKDLMLKEAKNSILHYDDLIVPERKYIEDSKYITLQSVNEEWGWEQLSLTEYNEYLEAEAFAAHYGQFIHKGSILDNLRKELPKIAPIEWMSIKDGEKHPVFVEVHHTSEQLLGIYEELASIHRTFEQKVNYYKAKVKNLVTVENARIAKLNADTSTERQREQELLDLQFEKEVNEYSNEVQKRKKAFEIERQEKISTIASMRIDIALQFQDVINSFLNSVDESKF